MSWYSGSMIKRVYLESISAVMGLMGRRMIMT